MISVVVPALNEAASITGTVSTIRHALTTAAIEPFEVVVVNDGSSDDTAALAGAAGARVISHAHPLGYGASLKDGIHAAAYDGIVIIDADGTYPGERIPELVRHFQSGFDMVVGARTGEHYRESALKEVLRWILKAIVQFTASRAVADINSGFRIFSRATAVRYMRRVSSGFSFTTSLTLAYMMNDKCVLYVPITYSARVGRSNVRLLSDSVKTLQYVLEAATFYNPLRIFGLLAFLTLCFSAISLAAALAFQLLSLFQLAVGAILASMLIMALGLLAVLLKQIMETTQPS